MWLKLIAQSRGQSGNAKDWGGIL